jgi:hypothetical protein
MTSEPQDEQTRPNGKPSKFSWPQAITIIAVVAILVGAAVFVLKSILNVPRDVATTGREVLHDIREIAAAFNTGTVTTTFISYAAEVSGSNYLQFATLRQTEIFERKDHRTALWGQLELPEVVVQARAPVEYTYYLDLNGKWEMKLEDQTVLVIAPNIQFNTPAVDASAIRYEVREGSIFRDEEDAMKKLQDGLMKMSRLRARDNIELIRELGRAKTEEFVRNWLAQTYSDGTRFNVDVRFADELATTTIPRRVGPEG